MKKTLLLFMALFSFSLLSFGQTRLIKGTVTEVGDLGLPGVTILEKGTSNGTISDVNGVFQITVSNDTSVLVFSFIGMTTQEVSTTGKDVINVILDESTIGLEEVVAIGFGSQKKDNITGATSFVKMDEIIGDRPIVNSSQALQGISAGLQVVSTSGQPGNTNTSLNIRGFTSINGGSPLVLVDNVPMSLNDVNPRDIESVSVLKDAAASSIYGARAAFGVILITTKKAEKNQPIKFDFSTTNSFATPSELPEKATTREFVEALDDWGVYRYFANQQVDKWLGYLDQYDADPGQLEFIVDPVTNTPYSIVLDPESGIYYPLDDTDIIGDLLDNSGFSTINNFTMSGGSKAISYRINAGYSHENGILVTDNDTYNNFNLNAYLSADITKTFKSTTNIFYRSSVRTNPIGAYSSAIQLRMYDPIGYFELPDGEVLPFASPANQERYRIPTTVDTDNLRLFEKLDYSPIKDLTFTGEFTYQKGVSTTRATNNQYEFASTFKFVKNPTDPENTRYTRGYSDFINYALNLYGKYDKSFNNHNFTLLLGFNQEKRIMESFSAYRKNLISVSTPGIDTAMGEYGGNDSYGDWAVMGFFGRLNYNYKERYFFEANGRYDGSSKFAEGSRYGFFPSFSAGWNIARESFMESVDMITSLKIRGSWGEIGNQNTGDLYPTIPGYSTPEARWINLDTDLRYVTINPAQLVSPLLTWETVQTANLGLDAGFFRNRLGLSADIYSRKTLDMLIPGMELPATLGTEAPYANAADLQTKGWELELSWKDQKGEFNYGVSFNLSDNQSEITKFDNPAGLLSQYYVGRQIGEIWGYVTDGYYTVDDFVEGTLDADLSGPGRLLKDGVVQVENAPMPYPGDVKYVDLNGDGVINDGNNSLNPSYNPETGEVIPNTGPGDRKIIGNSTRRFQFGLNGYANYKNFDFSLMLYGVGKRDQNLSGDLLWPYQSQFDHIYKNQLDYWTPDNQNAYFPRIYGNPNDNTGSNYGRSRYTQTKYLSNGSMLRIQNITLGYSLSNLILEKANISKLRFFVAGNNLFTFDNLPKGIDPDQSTNGVYPIMRSFSVGLNLSF